MHFRPVFFVLSVALLFASGTGCQKSESTAPAAPPTVLSPGTVASVHWLGKKRLGITAGAYYFTRIWQQPQSAQLERQTLIKLGTAPGEWLSGGANLTADACSRLWWLLNDFVQEESYLEIRAATSSEPSFVFAIRLNGAQNDQWLTNLPVILEPLTGDRAVNNAVDHTWSLKTTNIFNLIQFTRVGDWTVVSAGPPQNSLAGEIAARIRRDGVPFISAATNNLWLEASLDLPRLVTAFPAVGGKFSNFQHLDLGVGGDGGYVVTRAKLSFSDPLPVSLEPWRLPVELMHEPLTSFTAMRGLQSWLTDWPAWRDLNLGTAPDQLYLWTLAGSPYQVYLAAPLPDAPASVAALTDRLLQKGNPWLAAKGYISFDRAADGNGVTWGTLHDLKPFIKSAGAGADGWLFAGLLPDPNSAAPPPPAGMIQDILHRPNLVYYDWEVTGPRLQPVLELAQTARQIARRPPLAMDCASLQWLGALIPRLGTAATLINRTGPAELTLYRRSTLGLTATELHLLAGWLESFR
jgi:hypothetical protein